MHSKFKADFSRIKVLWRIRACDLFSVLEEWCLESCFGVFVTVHISCTLFLMNRWEDSYLDKL